MNSTTLTNWDILIGGAWLPGSGGTFDVNDPATGRIIATVSNGSTIAKGCCLEDLTWSLPRERPAWSIIELGNDLDQP